MNTIRIVIAASLCLASSAPVWATMDNGKSMKQAYPGKKASTYSCAQCHQGMPLPKGKLSAYGQALKNSKAGASAKKLTVEDYRAIEKDDADKDGFTNGEEIAADTNPSDAQSHPAAR